MDLIRIFTELTFARTDRPIVSAGTSYDDKVFLNCGRIHYPELSDNRLENLFSLFKDKWQTYSGNPGHSNIFNVLRHMAAEMLTINGGMPCVTHPNLLRWNEISQHLGSEIFVSALLADRYLHHNDSFRPDMSWPQVLNCDNPELNHLYRSLGLVELHSHLKASTNVFEISWLCLMNFVKGRRTQFSKVDNAHGTDDNRSFSWYLTAFSRRLMLFKRLILGQDKTDFEADIARAVRSAEQFGDYGTLDTTLQLLRNPMQSQPQPDYILNRVHHSTSGPMPMDIFRGERTLLYLALRRIFIDNDPAVTQWLYEYILAKNHIRRTMIQINRNMGFANFARFESIKEIFIDGDRRYAPYRDLLKSQPVWTARRHHFVSAMETRITPKPTARSLNAELTRTARLIERPLDDDETGSYGLICHFIKRKEAAPRRSVGTVMEHERDYKLRDKVRREALAISRVRHNHPRLLGIDAAASELDSRPEVFAQGFRFLRHDDLRFTYHAGEDFYDLADGLRTIDEAVTFFGMQSGDRIGHGTALAIDVRRFYDSCHRSIAIPAMTLLDNVAWLYARSYQLGARIDDGMRHRLAEDFAKWYSDVYGADTRHISPDTYHMAMCLRGDNPLAYDTDAPRRINPIDMIDSWHRCDFRHDRLTDSYRRHSDVVRLYWRYHFDKTVSDNGQRMAEFSITDSYISLISDMQTRMMEHLGRQRIAVECCPTSNLKISQLGRYDNHPVFHLSDPRHMPPVRPAATVNTDDLGIFCTSLDNEYNLLAAAMLKQTDADGTPRHTLAEVRARIESLIHNGHIYTFIPH